MAADMAPAAVLADLRALLRAGLPVPPAGLAAEAMAGSVGAESRRAALRRLRPRSLAHHPDGWLARNVLQPEWATVSPRTPAAPCMARELVPGVLGDYFAAVEEGRREPGLVNWPLPFLLC
jgi:hypothetical protein